MKHDELQEKIFLLNDKELPEIEAQEIKNHLKVCSSCEMALENWNNISGSFQTSP